MNWNIFKRLRDAENASLMHALTLNAQETRIDELNLKIETLAVEADRAATRALNAAGRYTELRNTLDVHRQHYKGGINTALDKAAELEERIYFMENSMKPAVIKTAAERLTKAQAYRRDYYQKRKAAMAKLAELKGATK